MKNKIEFTEFEDEYLYQQELSDIDNIIHSKNKEQKKEPPRAKDISEILFITSYPPRECGIATYSQDLIKALNNKFSNSLTINVCALQSDKTNYNYPAEVSCILNTSLPHEYEDLATFINNDSCIRIVLIQHEFGFFKEQEQAFLQFLYALTTPVIIVFHTVLPNPEVQLKAKIKNMAAVCSSIVVMTHNSSGILVNDYGISPQKIEVIAHGTHLVLHLDENFLKMKYGLKDRDVLTTFGLLSAGKSIETTIEALPSIVKNNPRVIFLVIGKTHPEVKKVEGEVYRERLEKKVEHYSLQDHVLFINNYLALPDLLEYLQLTDIYLFTTNDPNQAVSGTFSYAMSCACPIISTPIPHAREALTVDTGIIFDFRNSQQLANGVIRLLSDSSLRRNMSSNTLQNIVSTAWENSAIAHAMLFKKNAPDKITIRYNIPSVNLDHLMHLTTHTGIVQFSKINQPDINTGYTLDDNARALVAMCMHFKLTGDETTIHYIRKYLNFIKHCQQPNGAFLNYVNKYNKFTLQNDTSNLDDSNGRAIWALGYTISLLGLLPGEIVSEAEKMIEKSLLHAEALYSTRAMAFAIKGIYYYEKAIKSPSNITILEILANRLVQMYKHESSPAWEWFEGYLTYANSVLPEALLCAWLTTRETIYKDIAISSFDFLLKQTFNKNGIEVISNKNWLQKGQEATHFGEQPIDVAYTILALDKFYKVFRNGEYRKKLDVAFNWFLGQNRLHQIIYNPCTGGCYDGLEETHVNLNQGAEATVSYLMARLTIETYNDAQ